MSGKVLFAVLVAHLRFNDCKGFVMAKRIEIKNRDSGSTESHVVNQKTAVLKAKGPVAVKVVAAKDEVAAMERDGNDLVLRFTDGSDIRLEDYFDCAGNEASQLSFADPATGHEWTVSLAGITCQLPASAAATSEQLTYAFEPVAERGGGMGIAPIAGLGLLALGGLAAAAGGGGGGGGGTPTPPTPPTDTTPPGVPTISPSNGKIIRGTAEANAKVNLDLDGNGSVDATVVVDASGNWTYTPATPIPNGTRVTATATDAANNTSGQASVIVDAAAPPVPVIGAVTDDVAPVVGAVANGSSTNDTRPAISGSGTEAGATISVYDNGTLLGTTTADAAGAWTFTPATALPQGSHSFTATATDALGNVSAPSPAFVVSVDTAAPAVPAIGSVTDDVGAVTGTVANGGVTDDTRPAISGTGVEANATISVFDNGTLLGTTTANAAGAWSFTPTTALAQGAHSFTATATDAAGNASAPSAAYAVTIDTAAPASTVVIASVTDDVAPVTGNVANGGTTNDTIPVIVGTGAEANSTVSIFDNGTLLGTTTANGAGAWTFTPAAALAQGAHSFTATSTDAAGNASTPSGAYAVTIDTTVPASTLVIASVTDDVAPITGTVANGGTTNDTIPAIAGTGAEANSTVSVFDNGTLLGTTTANGAGVWSFTPSAALTQGAHSFTATATDAAGNVSGPSAAYAVTIDTAAPAVLTIASVTDDVAAATGTVANGGLTNDTRPAIAGTGAEANATISVYDNGTLLGTTTANGAGAWSFTPATALGQGAHSFTATATDAAGNVGAASAAYAVTIDSLAPAIPVINPTDGGAVTGTAEPGATVNLDTDGNGTPDVSVPVDGSGNWSYTPPATIPDGTTIAATATDPAGNTSGPATTVVDDAAAPSAPTITSVTDDVAPVVGNVANGGATNDTIPVIAGMGAQPNATVSVYDNGTLIGTTTANGTGTWTFTPTATLGQGAHSFTATTTVGGDVSAPSTAYAITIDTTAPAIPLINPTDGGAVTGTAEPGATVNLDVDGNAGVDVSVPVDGAGNWSYTPPTPLPDGRTITATATDPAGNTSGPATAIVDAGAPPSAPVITSVIDDVGALTGTIPNGGLTDDALPTISGSGATAGATISVYDNGTLLGTTTANGAGAWSFTPTAALGQGAHSFTATATAGGDVSPSSAPYAVTIDTTAPASTLVIASVTDDVAPVVGVVANGGSTNDTIPVIAGTGAEANSTVSVFDNGTLLGTTTANGAGAWTFTPAAALPQGAHSFTVTATDAAGNVSAPSAAYAVTIDTTAPASTLVIATVTDDVAPVLGVVANGGATNDTIPVIAGTGAEANSTVSIFDNGTLLGTATANGAGAWTFTPAAALPQGPHSFTATATDAAGNVSAPSAAYAITIDTAAPASTIVIGAVTDNVGPVTGTVPNGGTTDDAIPEIVGTGAEANSTVSVFDNGVLLGTTTANGAGAWTFVPAAALPAGPHSFTAVSSDAAGNASAPSAAYAVTIDTAAPVAPAIGGVADDVGAVTGNVANGGVTDDTRPAISGTGAEANATISVYDNGTLLGTTTANGAGAWTFTPATALGQGAHSFTATATDGSGNVSPPSAAYAITIDTAAPIAPTIGTVTDDVVPLTGTVANGGFTNDTIPVIAGTGAEANAVISVYDNGTLLGTTNANGAGAWTFTPPAALPQGAHSFTATAADAVGNVSAPSAAYVVTVDTTPPGAPVINPTDGGAVTGTAEPSSTVNLDIGNNGSIDATVPVDASGNWSYTPPAVIPDDTVLSATATDPAGNTSLPGTATVDVAAPPSSPVINAIADDVAPVTGNVANGGSTNDTIPVISGAGAQANALITVYDNGVLLGTTTANGAGAWTFTPPAALPQGPHSFTATATVGGDVSAMSAAYAVTIDTTAPGIPAIGSVTDDVGAVVGVVANGGVTDDTRPAIAGTSAEANAVISVYDNGVLLGTTTANGAGAWTFTPAAALPQGPHSFTVTATDAAGNASAPSAAYAVTIDTAAPVALTIGSVTDDVAPIVGVVANGGTTNDALPAIAGTGAEPNATITVYDNGVLLGTTTANGAGAWSFTPAAALPQGAHSFTVTATDVAGNVGAPSAAYAITIDTAAPASTVVIGSVTDDVAPVVGIVASGGVTNDTIPVIAGTGAEANSTVSVFDNGILLGTTTANGAGAWTFTPAAALSQGIHSFTAVSVDAAGNASAPSTSYTVTIDTAAPAATVVISSVIDNVGLVVGTVANGGVTDDTIPAISGTGAEANTTVSVYDNGTLLGTTTADGAGAWTFTPAAALPAGAHSFTATSTDAAGNMSAPSAAYAVTIDTTAPTVLTIGSVTDDVAPVLGVVANGGVTNDTVPVVSGTGAEANATITVYDNGTLLGTTTANVAGVWSFTPAAALPQGPHSFTVTATDAAGNVSTPSAAYAITVDTSAPASTLVIASVTDDVAPVVGVVANSGSTNDTIPVIAGTGAEANSTVSVFDNGTLLGTTTANGVGAWTFTPAAALPTGAHSFTATATDAAGNVSAPSTAYAVTIDTTAPATLAIAAVTDDVAPVLGVVANGGATNDTIPAISGTGAEANAVVSVYDNGTLLGTATANGAGAWSFTPAAALPQGAHSFTVTATDAAGNVSAPSAAYAITIDTAAPAALTIVSVTDDTAPVVGVVASGGSTNDTIPVIAGTGAEANATVSVYENGNLLGTTTADGTGAWTFTPAAALPPGLHSFTATATDAAGNVSAPSAAYAITIDTSIPTVPAIGSITDDVAPIIGTVANGGVTNDTIPQLSGTGAEPNATISIFDNGTLLGTTTANGAGGWTFTPAAALPQGPHSFTATAMDAAGNVSGPSAAYAITIDTAAPAALTIVSVTDDVAPVVGVVANGGSTNDTIPVIAGTGAEAFATVSVFDNGVLMGTTTANGAGAWSFTPSARPQGTHSFTATSVDAAGNVSVPSTAYVVTVDTAAPASTVVIASVTDDVAPVVGTVANGGATNDTIPVIAGTGAEANSTVSVFDNGVLLGTTTANGAGAWSFTPPAALPQGAHSFTATSTDAAGNASAPSAAYAITIDTAAPAALTIVSVTDDVAPIVGVVANGGSTNDTIPVIAGTGAEANATVSVFDNGTLLGTTTANGAGAWSFTPSARPQGTHSFTATAVDPAGNVSTPSVAYVVTVDTAAPAAVVNIATLTDDTGAQGDWSTEDLSPTFGGTLTQALAAGERVEVRLDGGAWVTATTTGTTWFYGYGTLAAGAHTVEARVIDLAGNAGAIDSQPFTLTNVNQAPIVQANDVALLGLISAEVLGLIDINDQSLVAFDPDNNLQSVVVRYGPLLSLNLGAYTLTASQALATELGLVVTIENDPGLLTILAPSSTLTITALGGGTIDNRAINELLATVHFEQNLTLLGAQVLSATRITATDSNGLTDTDLTGTLVDASVLNNNGDSGVIEGNGTAQLHTGGSANERIYGHGGNDTLIGGVGNDLLRGGAGVDSLQGGDGNDVLIYDATDALIDGEVGFDTLAITAGTGLVLNLNGGATNIRNVERIDLGVADGGRSITLTEAGIIQVTDADRDLFVTGDGADSVTLMGGVYEGQVLFNNHAYSQYALGTATVFVEASVGVFA
jgi:hypothetical protein